MATSKTLTPTGVTIQIPEFTDQPDQRVNSNCIDKEADAINALNSKITKFDLLYSGNPTEGDEVPLTYNLTNYLMIMVEVSGYNNYATAIFPATTSTTSTYYVQPLDTNYRLGVMMKAASTVKIMQKQSAIQFVKIYGVIGKT